MKDIDLYKMVKQAIFDAPACPDGMAVACPSCAAEMVTWRLINWGHVQVTEFTMSDPSASI